MSEMRKAVPRHLNKSEYARAERACALLVNCPMFNPFDSYSEKTTSSANTKNHLMSVQMAHCFRFTVEYLFRSKLLWVDGGQLEPNDLAAFVAHIFFMEPSNFAFLSLLTADNGLPMRRLCRISPGHQAMSKAEREREERSRAQRVLAVVCNIFCRTRLPRTVADHARQFPAATGPSTVLLPGLDNIGDLVSGPDGQMIKEGKLLKEILRKHNAEAVGALVGYWKCFVKAYAEELGNDDMLPISGTRC